MTRHEASCSCGALRAVAETDPVRVTVCHCLACQRRTGSAFGVQARFERHRVTLSGPRRSWTRRADDDGEARTFLFCPTCGATVAYTWETLPELIALPVGGFADPAFPAPGREIYRDRAHPWVEVRLTDGHENA